MQTAQMAGNFNYQPRTRNRPPSKRGQLKEAHHRKSRSSSDDEEFHSDDNLRPYEEVKVAYHDKKLDGLGIATPESVELSALGVSHPERRLNIQKNSNFYKYMETSDGEGDSEHNVSTNTGSLNVHNQGSQCSISSNELDNQTFKQISDVPRLTDSGLSSRLTNSPAENHNHHRPFTSHYPQACVPTSLPPCFAPPPPPIEDIPHRTTAPPCRQRSFGPSNRGNYSDAETCLCRSPYADASTALLHSCPPHRGHYSDGEQYPQLRHCPYSGEESDFEPHYLEQTASGNVYIPDHSRCPQTVPRSGSVPLSRSNEMVNSPLIRPQTSHTVPNHFVNGDHVNQDRRFFHSTFPCQQVVAMSPNQHVNHDCGYYTKFSCTSHQMKKKLAQRCSWKLTSFILVIVCVALLACALVFAASAYFEDKEKVAHTSTGALNDSQPVLKFTHPFTVFHVGQVKQSRIPPKTIWQTKFIQNQNKFVKFNFSLSRSAIISVYGRRYFPPTIAQFDFSEVFNANHIASRQPANARVKRSYVQEKDTALIHYMEEGEWFLSVYNDRDTAEYMSFKTDLLDSLGTDCPNDCNGRGDCLHGKCSCFPGFKGWDCSEYECPELCSRHGKFENGVCQCHKGWKGRECEIPEHECAVTDCNGNGQCINGKCKCRAGFRGPHCGLVTCIDPNCSGHGVCHLGKCVCYKGYTGLNCNTIDKINVTQICARDCSGHGTFDLEKGECQCNYLFTGPDCEQEICRLKCQNGHCHNQRCQCMKGWSGVLCDKLSCDQRCDGLKGRCHNGTCICNQGWNGKHCTIDGCPNDCSGHGDCRGNGNEGWKCNCHTGWKGRACDQTVEQQCEDGKDDDRDGLTDCADPDCCLMASCRDHILCRESPDPDQILIRRQPPSSSASFYEKMKFLIQNNGVQKDTSMNAFNESQASVIRGRVVTKDKSLLVGVVVRVSSQPLYGYTLSRRDGMYDILVNGGGSVTLEFTRTPFQSTTISVLVPWNQIINIEDLVMLLDRDQLMEPDPSLCGVHHDHYLLRPVVLSTWQHTQLGACPDKSTIIPESQVLQESIKIPGTDVHLVYHSSETEGYKSVILIQLTPSIIPTNLALVYIKVSVQGVQFEKTFEADPGLKYTYAWDRKNAYKQKVYGIVPATVHVGYQYTGCDYIFWEVRTTTMTGFDLSSSEIGGWNLDIHHTYNFQRGILHKGDGSNIYMSERPKELITVLGTGDQRSLDCGTCNGLALNNRVHSPVALASGRDGSLYIWDLNFIRRLSPSREDIASILQISTSHKPYMTVSPVDGRLYLSDMINHRVIRVGTMGPVRNLSMNYEVVAGDGEECTPGSLDECGDGGLAINARLVHPKGIAISKEGIVYIADNLNIRRIDNKGKIMTLIGSQGQLRAWEPMSCEDSQPASKARLQWPTDLAVDPVDNTLHILDKNVILKLTKDNFLVTVAGRPINCPIRSSHFMLSGVIRDEDEASRIAADIKLVNPQSIAFSADGELYVVESDTHSVNRVRVVTSDGRIHHYAGKKSKCDCQTCVCFDPSETLATQALFKELTSVSVTPDGVVHISDSGNLRIFSIISKLPEINADRQYKVFSPDTQEVYIFNEFGQHRHTVNIMSSQYMYNFTYNVNSFFGKLDQVSDDADNKVKFIRDYEKVKEIVSPDGLKSKLSMDDNQKRLIKFTSPSNSTTTFTYLTLKHEGLIQMKHLSTGLVYSYSYDDMGRLLEAKEPTGEITRLSTDVNTTGSIVRVNTDSSDSMMMATYDSVQSVKRGSAETQLTYLPDGTVVMMFPTNLSISIESGGHPVLANQHRLHFKRKIIAPNKLVHRLEWRYYVRKRLNSHGVKEAKRLGNRMRVGAMLSSQHASMLDSHDNLFDKGKVLLINGKNLLTVEYDRDSHSEKIINNKNQREILAITYDDSGLPVRINPGNGHIPMNISYSQAGHITYWRYGEMYETLRYNAEGALTEKTLASNGQYRYVYRYSKTRPTDVVMPDGVQYSLEYSNQGDLVKVRTPDLGNHYFAKVTSIGIQRYLYYVPQRENPYCEEYDGNGKLLHIIYPSEQKRVMHRYNSYSQLSNVLFDETEVTYKYNPDTLQLVQTRLVDKEGRYECVEDFNYLGSLISSYLVDFSKDSRMKSGKYIYTYDSNFRVTEVDANFGEGTNSTLTKFKFEETTGKVSSLYGFSASWILSDKEEISDGQLKITRGYDKYARLNSVTYSIKSQDVFVLRIGYDFMNRIQGWDSHIGTDAASKYQYIYNINGYIKEIILNGQSTWRFGYNNNGNINSVWEGGSTRSLDYDVGDRIRSSGTKVFKFDPDGFMIFRKDHSILFNSKGQLKSVSKPNEYRFFYSYDSTGRLVSMETNGGEMMQYFYADVVHPLRITHTYRYGLREEFTEYLYETEGKLIGLRRDGNQYYIASDPMGSPIAVFDFDGQMVKVMTYHPLGRVTKDTNPDFELCFGFQGGLYNPVTELVMLGMRTYDTDNGHWISPDYSGTLSNLKKVPENPILTNNYQYRDIINVQRKKQKFPMLDVSDWLSVLGFDMDSLVPDISYNGEIRKRSHGTSYSLLPMSSAFECTFVQDMKGLMKMSVVPQSKVSPLLSSRDISPIAVPGILGNGITVSYHEGKAVVSYASTAAPWSKQLAQVLINGSYIVDFKHNIRGKDIHYLLKYDVSKAEDEIRILGLEANKNLYSMHGVNISIHKVEHKARFHPNRYQEIDIRLKGKYSVINIRYGSTVDRERQRILNHSKERAVQHAWATERWLLENGLPPKYRQWTDDEKLQIKTLGLAEGYKGHYLKDVYDYPELADDCNNIRFIKDKR